MSKKGYNNIKVGGHGEPVMFFSKPFTKVYLLFVLIFGIDDDIKFTSK